MKKKSPRVAHETTAKAATPAPVLNQKVVELPGLEGSNPLAFLAALGLLAVLHEHRRAVGGGTPKLAWIERGAWIPAVTVDEEWDVIDVVLGDLAEWSTEPALALAYDSAGDLVADPEDAVRDLKPLPSAYRAFCQRVLDSKRARRRSLDLLAAWGSELITDNKGRLKPSAFHFTAGQQLFLDMVLSLRDGLERSHLEEALLGPWTRSSQLPSLSWDSSALRQYALRASNPSGEKRGSTPGADWLGVVGMTMFPTCSHGERLLTTGVRGGWKDSNFTWPIWTAPADLGTARSLVAWQGLPTADAAGLRMRGIQLRFTSDISRSDQGGYGSFSPAAVI